MRLVTTAACVLLFAGHAADGAVPPSSDGASDLAVVRKTEERPSRVGRPDVAAKNRDRTVVAPLPSVGNSGRKAIEAEVAKAKRLADEAARKAAAEKVEAERRRREDVLENINRKRRPAK